MAAHGFLKTLVLPQENPVRGLLFATALHAGALGIAMMLWTEPAADPIEVAVVVESERTPLALPAPAEPRQPKDTPADEAKALPDRPALRQAETVEATRKLVE
jgi:hypothetical protein